jgi:hypothetical protein
MEELDFKCDYEVLRLAVLVHKRDEKHPCTASEMMRWSLSGPFVQRKGSQCLLYSAK